MVFQTSALLTFFSLLLSKLEQAASNLLTETALAGNPRSNSLVIQTLGKVDIVREDLDGHAARILVKDDGSLDKLVDGAGKVVGAAAAVGQVQSALALGVALGEDFKHVKLAALGPAAAGVVLGGTGDLAVEGPDGGHVAVEAAVAVEGHLEVEEEDFVAAGEALVGNVRNARVAARLVALFAAKDGKFLVGWDEDALQGLGVGRAAVTIGIEVRDGVAPDTKFCKETC
jgi:hypothetical protein